MLPPTSLKTASRHGQRDRDRRHRIHNDHNKQQHNQDQDGEPRIMMMHPKLSARFKGVVYIDRQQNPIIYKDKLDASDFWNNNHLTITAFDLVDMTRELEADVAQISRSFHQITRYSKILLGLQTSVAFILGFMVFCCFFRLKRQRHRRLRTNYIGDRQNSLLFNPHATEPRKKNEMGFAELPADLPDVGRFANQDDRSLRNSVDSVFDQNEPQRSLEQIDEVSLAASLRTAASVPYALEQTSQQRKSGKHPHYWQTRQQRLMMSTKRRMLSTDSCNTLFSEYYANQITSPQPPPRPIGLPNFTMPSSKVAKRIYQRRNSDQRERVAHTQIAADWTSAGHSIYGDDESLPGAGAGGRPPYKPSALTRGMSVDTY